jgi:VWFA-related protein
MRVWVLLLAVLAGSVARAQPPSAPAPPVFGVDVDVVAVDAAVVDQSGRPVTGLLPEDFRVSVGGKPRRVVSAEFLGTEAPTEPAPAPPSAAHFSSNEDQAPGRLVLVLVDLGNIARGGGRHVFAAASRFVERLPSSDRVGLVTIPGQGKSLDFTAPRERVSEALRGLVGQGDADRGIFRVPVTEAVAYLVHHDQQAWERFIDVECAFQLTADRLQDCRIQLEGEAVQVLSSYRERSLRSKRALLQAMRSLRAIEGPKTVVLLSEGLWTEDVAEMVEIAEAAAEAQVTVYSVLLDKPGQDAEFRRGHVPTGAEEAAEQGTLHDLSATTRGAVLPVTGTADAPFARLDREMSGYYLLGFEPEAGDRDGKNHEVAVEVSRPGATVRSRRLLNIPASPPTTEALLLGALRSPRLERALAVRVATFATHAAGEKGRVRLLIAGRVATPRRPVSLAFTLSGADGKVATARSQSGVAAGEGEWGEFVADATVAPGAYRLRLVVVDASGRRGSVEHQAKAALVSAGGLEVSDLVLGPTRADGGVRPAVDLEADGGVSGLVEIGSEDRTRLEGATVAFEIAEAEGAPAILRVPVAAAPAGEDGARLARVSVAAGLLPPGRYFARAEVSAEGKPVATAGRPFRIVAARAGAASGGLAAQLVPAPAYDRQELLRPEPLAHFVDRVLEIVPGTAPEPVAAAAAQARAGRPEAMLDHLREAARPDARTDFLRGVSYYARGDVRAALTQLQAAARRAVDLFPAAVYLGACHAALGRDLDAIAAWQTSLAGETQSPVLVALLSDALVRAGEADQAASLLAEGLAAHPGDSTLRRRLALAHARAGNAEQALPLLGSWVEENPGDEAAVLATLGVLFEGFSRESTGLPPGERERLVRYARSYVAGQGPNRGVVERWLRYLEERSGV